MTKTPPVLHFGQPRHDGIDEIVTVPHLPVLRLGQPYESLDVADIKRIASDKTAVRISQANPGLVRRDLLNLKEARAALTAIPARQLMEITRTAGEYFFKERLPLASGITQTPEEYVRQLSSTSGLPHALIHMNMRKLYDLMAGIDGVFAGLSRGLNPDILDSGIGEQAGVPVSYNASTHSLGVILPSNSPAVNALWIPALMMKIPVVLKPGREEPWTPWRLIQSFLKAGMPASAFGFYPTSHEGSQAIIRGCGRVMVFGDDKTVSQYASDPRVEVHGTGHSKILIGEDMADHWREFLPTLIESVSANSGRSCINASTIVTPRHG
ncbi:MAG: mmsA, partial [Verrucomicrobiaceae bacterium]|nr:mmsA [Verrucomicrobiaceae bacterium]